MRPLLMGTRRRVARPSVVLPLPDSPTRATVSPRARSRSTSLTAAMGRVAKNERAHVEADAEAFDAQEGLIAPGAGSASWRGLAVERLHGARLRLRVGSSSRQRATCPGGPAAAESGATLRQASKTSGQRGANRQPGNWSRRSGGAPGRKRGGRSSCRPGMLARSDCVYGIERAPQDLLGGAELAHLARVDDRDAVAQVAGERQVVGDEEHRDAALGLELLEQVHDLRLDAHVERAGGLVEDEQRRVVGERAWRS